MKFQIIVASYNSMDWLPKTLQSIADQNHENFNVCVVDDASTDTNQWPFIKSFCEEHGWMSILHKKNTGALYSQVEAIRTLDPDDDDIIVWVDGDDWLINRNVLKKLEGIYKSGNYLMTYGSYASEPYSRTCPQPSQYPREVVLSNSYRKAAYTHGILFNHLRTVKYSLFKHLDESDFTWPDGSWFRCAGDTAVMIACLELAGGRYKYIDVPLYVYNTVNPVSDWRRCSDEIDRTHSYILKKLKPKKPLVY
jgi:glycosyltransferase involved in cell wall biosynthesis